MAEILLDSDVIIAWLRGHNPFAELIPGLLEKGHLFTWTPVSVAEIFAGVRKGEEDRVENLFLVLSPALISAEVGRKAAGYLKSYARSHDTALDSQQKTLSHAGHPLLFTLTPGCAVRGADSV